MNDSEKTSIDFAKSLKAETERQIFKLLTNYESETELQISSITLEWNSSGAFKILLKVGLEVKI